MSIGTDVDVDTAVLIVCCTIIIMQAMAAVLNPSVFTYALIYKFRLEKWLTK